MSKTCPIDLANSVKRTIPASVTMTFDLRPSTLLIGRDPFRDHEGDDPFVQGLVVRHDTGQVHPGLLSKLLIGI